MIDTIYKRGTKIEVNTYLHNSVMCLVEVKSYADLDYVD